MSKAIVFSEREERLIKNAIRYAREDPAGLPGHNLMVIIEKMATALEEHGLVAAQVGGGMTVVLPEEK